jgi:hypothetical protein
VVFEVELNCLCLVLRPGVRSGSQYLNSFGTLSDVQHKIRRLVVNLQVENSFGFRFDVLLDQAR